MMRMQADPDKPGESQSSAKRSVVIDWYRSTLLSRPDNLAHRPIVVVQRRVHETGVAGTLLEVEDRVHLVLPAIAEKTANIPSRCRGKVGRHEGHLLHEVRPL